MHVIIVGCHYHLILHLVSHAIYVSLPLSAYSTLVSILSSLTFNENF